MPLHLTPLQFTLSSQSKHTPTDIIGHLRFAFQSMHTQYWMCAYTGPTFWPVTSKHIQDARPGHMPEAVQFSVTLSHVCNMWVWHPGGLWGIGLWCGQPLPGMKGQCCGNRDREDQSSTVIFTVCPQDTHIWMVLFSVYILAFSLSLSLPLTDLTSLSCRCPLLK